VHKDDLAYHSFFENSVYPMLIIENGEFINCNSAAVTILGYDRKEEFLNTPPFKLSPEFQPDGYSSFDKATEIIRLAEEKGAQLFEWEHLRKDGSILLVEVALTAINTEGIKQLHTIWRDLSRRKHRDQKLRESEERFREIFEINPDPAILTEPEAGVIIDVNKAFETATGIPRLEAIGYNSDELGLWVDKGLHEFFCNQIRSHGEINNYEADFLVTGDQVRTGLLSARTIRISVAPFILIVIRDITTEKEAERALIEMNKMKSEFISTAAHELRTPITGIMGYTELLSDCELSVSFNEEQRQDFCHEIYDNCERLSRIVDDILDVSRIESGQKLPLEREATSIVTLLNKVADHFALRTKRKITVELKPEAPQVIMIDVHRIRQVIDNLLSNAIKYSPQGSSIAIVISREGQHCKVGIIDQGIGMTKDQIARVFDKFYRVDTSDTAVSGLGLGMSIVRQIIEDHGGVILVESLLGEGSKVFFTLPITDD